MRAGALMAAEAGFPVLTALIATPAIGAAAVALTPRGRPELAKVLGVLLSVATAALAVYLLIEFEPHSGAQFQFVSQHAWIRSFGISWKVGVDGISLFLVVMTAGLFPI